MFVFTHKNSSKRMGSKDQKKNKIDTAGKSQGSSHI